MEKRLEKFNKIFGDCDDYILIGIKSKEEYPYKIETSGSMGDVKKHLIMILDSSYRDVA